jgi:hypothetical protein
MSKKQQQSDHAQKGPGIGGKGATNPVAKAPARPASLGSASTVPGHSRGKDGKTR